MKYSQLQLSLKRASKKLGIDTEIPFVLDLPCGRIEAEALVKDFGYECGVVININTGELGDLHKHLADFGYGAATLSDACMDAGGRATHDCMDAGDRATQGAVAEEAKAEPTYGDENDASKWMMHCREWGWRGKRNPPDWY